MDKIDNNFKELLQNQLKKVPSSKKLQYNDIKRISKYIDNSIFDENNCCIWSGYVTNSKKRNKGMYINFYFNGKKVALHRLLYINYVDVLEQNEYLKFNCENKGRCCNIHHMKKFKYNPTIQPSNINNENKKKNSKQNDSSIDSLDENSLYLQFD